MIRAGRSERLRPEDRLRRKADFDRLYQAGERVPSRSFTLIVQPATHGRMRLGLTVSRKVGNAVVRNGVRRRLREAFRRHCAEMGRSVDIVLHVKTPAAAARYADLEAELLEAWRRYEGRRERRS